MKNASDDPFSFDDKAFDAGFEFSDGSSEFDSVEETGKPSVDSLAEADVYRTEISKRADNEEKRRANATTSNFFFCLVFKTEDEAVAAKAMLGEGIDAKFIDGRKLVERLANHAA